MSADPARAEPQTSKVKRGGEVPFVPQLTPTDCGAACLAAALEFHGKHVPIHEVRAVLGGGRNG
jgi:ABC-type bacteriocin/lantibiotic exporter with double-glycine peptidase domain